jgi:hypothetical protein
MNFIALCKKLSTDQYKFRQMTAKQRERLYGKFLAWRIKKPHTRSARLKKALKRGMAPLATIQLKKTKAREVKKNKLRSLIKTLRTPKHAASSPFVLYRSCGQFPLSRFIRVLVDSDYAQLIISGKPNQRELLAAWRQINLEYISILDVPEVNFIMELQASIVVIEAKLFITEKIISTLYIIHDDRLTAMLRGLGFDFVFDPTDRVVYFKSLDDVDQQAGAWRLELEQKDVELKELESKDEDGKKFTDDYFDDILMVLSKSQGYHIRTADITASQFAVLLKRHRAKADQARYENHLKTQSF